MSRASQGRVGGWAQIAAFESVAHVNSHPALTVFHEVPGICARPPVLQHQRVPLVCPQDVDSSTRAVLTNAIYFKAK